MRRLIVILLCGIIATAASAGAAERRSGERPKDNTRTSTPAAAVTPARSTPPSAQPSFGNAGRPAATSYTPAPVSRPAPAPAARISSGNRGGYTFSGGARQSAPVQMSNDNRHVYSRQNAPAEASRRSPAPAAQPASNTIYRPGTPSPGRINTPPAPAVVSRPSPAPRDTVYRPGTPSPDRGNPNGRPAGVRNSTPAPVSHGPDNAGRRNGGPSGSTNYYPGGGSRGTNERGNQPTVPVVRQPLPRPGNETIKTTYKPTTPDHGSGRLPATTDRTTPRSGGPSATPRHDSPGTGYRPGNQSHQPGGQPGDGRHTVNRPTDNRGSFGGGRNHTAGNAPRRSNYTVGYRPSSRFVVPHDYKAPIHRQGRYHYAPSYHPKPCFFGYWAPIYSPGFSYRSLYFNFGLFPYVQVTHISARSYTTIGYVSDPVYVSGTYYHNPRYTQLDETLADIRSGWISGRYDLIEQHVRAGQTIAVLLDGQYDYSVSSDDYLSMTQDAIGDLSTASFVWDNVRERGDGTVTAFGKHSFRSSDETRTVYVSYTFQKIGRDYFITEVGSSQDPLN